MIRNVSVLGAMLLAASVNFAWAQTTPQQGGQSARPTLTTEQRQELREARRACRDEVKVDSSDRRARGRAMRECVEKKSPVARQIAEQRASRRAEARNMRRDCADGLRGRSMSRDERRQAMQSCMIAKRPELKKVYECSNQAREKGFTSGRERRDFMRTCRRS